MKTFKIIKEFCDTDLGGLVLSTVVMILVTIFAFLPIDARAVCASPISRTNSSANSVLTSTKYNLDLNTLYTQINELPGDCIEDNTITFDKLNTTSFATLLNGIQQGCKVTYSNASTVLIDKCIASVNGEFIRTTTTTSASFGCANCSSETSSTLYYLYIKNGSTGTTITPLILTSAPNNDGYDASNNKVLARFYNGSSSDIDQLSIDQWGINQFIESVPPQPWGSVSWATTTNCNWQTSSTSYANFSADADCDDNVRVSTGTYNATNVDAANSDGQLPQIKFSRIPKGVLRCEARGAFNANGTQSSNWRFSDGTNVTKGVTNYNGQVPLVVGEFNYTTEQGATTIQLQGMTPSGGQSDIYVLSADRVFEIFCFYLGEIP